MRIYADSFENLYQILSLTSIAVSDVVYRKLTIFQYSGLIDIYDAGCRSRNLEVLLLWCLPMHSLLEGML